MNIDNIVNHIAQFAMKPHWVDEMRRWTLELQKEHPTVFDGLGVAVAEQIKSLKEQSKDGG